MKKQFGTFKSIEELNMCAEGLKNEGDIESLKALAVENGLDPEDAQDYAEGYAETLATKYSAITGKIAMEKKELKLGDILEDWANFIQSEALEDDRIAEGVFAKSLSGCIAELLKYSYKNMAPVPAEIVKAAGISGGTVKLGIPGSAKAKQIIKEYYLAR